MTLQQLRAIMPKAGGQAAIFHQHLFDAMAEYGIDTLMQSAMWLANIAHETNELRTLEENFRYSAERMCAVFPKRFTLEVAETYEGDPERIASRVYAKRYGNGDEESGDGWRFRGKGLPQLTFRSTYQACGDDLGIDLVGNPDLLLEPRVSSRAAGWFWRDYKHCGPIADTGDFKAVVIKWNGGLNGWDDRLQYYERALRVLGEEV